jgi:uncharacterized protein with HEPN domain
MKENDSIRLKHILEAILEIESFSSGINLQQFQENRLIRNASIRSFEIIGEAINSLSNELKMNHSSFPWQDWKDFRNVLIHQYFGVDYQMVYDTILIDLPNLRLK